MIRAVEYYQIVCDEPRCTTSTAAWDDHWAALDEWLDVGGGQETTDGHHYCDAHLRPRCADCDETEGLVERDGDVWCPPHAPDETTGSPRMTSDLAGNAVTPPAARDLIATVVAAITGEEEDVA